jgi:hypothetical protein
MIRFACPSCGQPASAPEDCAGRSTRCRNCSCPITVPHATSESSNAPQSRDRTSLGRLISHSPTGVQGNPVPVGKLEPGPVGPTARRPQPRKRQPASAANVRRRSPGAKLAIALGMTLMVFAAGAVFGLGLYRYLGWGGQEKATDAHQGGAVLARKGEDSRPAN